MQRQQYFFVKKIKPKNLGPHKKKTRTRSKTHQEEKCVKNTPPPPTYLMLLLNVVTALRYKSSSYGLIISCLIYIMWGFRSPTLYCIYISFYQYNFCNQLANPDFSTTYLV